MMSAYLIGALANQGESDRIQDVCAERPDSVRGLVFLHLSRGGMFKKNGRRWVKFWG